MIKLIRVVIALIVVVKLEPVSSQNDKTNCGIATTGIANCRENGDENSSCVFGHHCRCSNGFVCDGNNHDGILKGAGECAPGVSCIPSKSACRDISRICNRPDMTIKRQCSFNTFIRKRCQKTCKLCGTSANKCKTISGPSRNKDCIFPFAFNGTRYNRCAFDSDGFWCSTKVDSTGSHITGNWGICGPNCPKVAAPSNRSNIVETVVSVRTLNGAGPFTVFAPNNDAFAKLLVNRLNQENTKKLRKMLLRHVVPKALKSGAIKIGTTILDTAGGEKITITKRLTKKTGITIKSTKGTATVIKADILASNGVIHIVDTVF